MYRGLGRFSICDNPADENANVDPKAMKKIRRKGTLEKIRINLLWRDFKKNFTPEKKGGGLNKCEKETISYEDALEDVGYPSDWLKFKVNFSKYVNDGLSIKTSKKKGDSDLLV